MCSISSFGQLLTVRSSAGGTVVNGTTLIVNGHSAEVSIDKTLYTTLNGAVQKEVDVKRYELNVQSGTKNTFCWVTCPSAVNAGAFPLWYSPFSLEMVAGFEYDSFKSSHEPMGITGTNTYLYVWYDVANPNDSVWVEIHYNVGTLGIEPTPEYTDLQAWQFNEGIQIKTATSGKDSQIQIFDAIGNLVVSQRIEPGKRTQYIAMPNGASGLYFVMLQSGSDKLISRKVFYRPQ